VAVIGVDVWITAPFCATNAVGIAGDRGHVDLADLSPPLHLGSSS
jgi:hypothetical protein